MAAIAMAFWLFRKSILITIKFQLPIVRLCWKTKPVSKEKRTMMKAAASAAAVARVVIIMSGLKSARLALTRP